MTSFSSLQVPSVNTRLLKRRGEQLVTWQESFRCEHYKSIFPCVCSFKSIKTKNKQGKEKAETVNDQLSAIPSNEDAQQINVVSPCKQHNHTKSQFEHKQPADNLVNAVTLAQCQEIQVVEVGGNVRDPCEGAEAELHQRKIQTVQRNRKMIMCLVSTTGKVKAY